MLVDVLQRRVKDLRISVTDRCNLRCTYCMPLEIYTWINREEILSYEEITRLARLFVRLGVEKIRITGGEALVRRDLHQLVAGISALAGLRDLCLTTNGVLLAQQAPLLAAAGLKRINVSVDTLDPATFRRMTGRDNLSQVLDGLLAARRYGLLPIKINAVIIRGVNDKEILPMVDFARHHGFAIRFIEFMDVGNVNQWHSDKLVSKREILQIIHARYPLREIGREEHGAPAIGYGFEDGRGEVGVIASVTEPFCAGCTRLRLTADGKLVTCLFSASGHDVKSLLRGGASDEEILAFIRSVWQARADRYSEERHAALSSGKDYRSADRTKIEMIRLGG